ncbi:MAG: hydantoinase/oxoprolinase family protein [Candidatus Rokubacteria bacterium]|nr:hydantoinase/oxoprolinase family protein [Candidatus Rokubacteria bacterium]
MAYRLGFDVGGTFTDFVLQSPSGELATAKRLTTYPDPSEACLAGLDELIAKSDVRWADIAQAVHGTTLGSNIVIERKAKGVGLLTTRGFRDVLIIGREKRYQVYDLQIEKPAPLIPRRLIGEVTERILADGSVGTPLDEADARRAIRELAGRGVTTLAICLLHAYLNPAHEKRLAAIVAEEAPHVAVTLSHEVSPTFREYERTSTTVVNAYVMTAVRAYLRGLIAAMGEGGYRGRFFVMQSSGGVATAEAMQRYPVRMIESGPAAGALMAAVYGELTGHRDLIAFDMGGTTAKLALIEQGRPYTTTAFELHRVWNAPGSGLPMNIQAIDLVEIGAGGGSIAQAKLGVIAVGPESAGSTPGPVCYGRGGIEPTVTDANVVLGYINPHYFAGGSIKLRADAAARAVEEKVARLLGLSLEDAAWGIHAIVNTNMELATRVVSIERGRDPRDLTFVAFGGSGPVHGCRLAQALGIPRVILPAAAGVTAAIGLLAAEVRFDVARTYVRRLDAVDPAHLNRMYEEMATQALEVVRESAAGGEIAVARAADARYVGQGYELTVPVPSGTLDGAALARVRASFDEIYAARYGYANAKEPVEIVTWKLSAVGGSPQIALAKASGKSGAAALKGTRRAYFPEARGYVDTPVYDRYTLAAGMRLEGPAIVEERESTTVLPPGAAATVDAYASLIVEVGAVDAR